MKSSVRLVVLAVAVVACRPHIVLSQTCDNVCDGTNTALGSGALSSDDTGGQNVAIGYVALGDNTAGDNNVAVGYQASLNNDAGNVNVALGADALFSNTDGDFNTAVGANALYSNTTNGLTAVGYNALTNSTGIANVAVGYDALSQNTTGIFNTAVGYNALTSVTTGGGNVALGLNALSGCTGSYNIGIGLQGGTSLTSGSSNIDIGNNGVAAESNTIRIGTSGTQTATYIAGISGQTSSSGVAVFINTSGKLGTTTSSARFKDDITEIGDRSSGLMKLRPVRFRYKQEIDPSGLEQYGLVAEEVAKVYPDLVVYDDAGRPETVRYHFINAMLLNEVQKQAHHTESQERLLKAQARQIQVLTTQVRQATAQQEEIATLTARLVRLEGTVGLLRQTSAVMAALPGGTEN